MADEFEISRADQDALAVESHRRAAAAAQAGYFDEQITPVQAPARKGTVEVVKALYELRRTAGRYAVVTMCIGGGQGIAAIFERM